MINCAEDPSHALRLTRYHSWPRLRDESNGEHSAQIARILLTVWPDCPRRMLVHCVVHDTGEMAGDIQYPYKQKYPELKPLMDRIEADVRAVMGTTIGMPVTTPLSNYEITAFKLCEYLQMWEYGLHEIAMGNSYAKIIANRCIRAASILLESMESLRENSPDIRPAIKSYVSRRTEWETQNG